MRVLHAPIHLLVVFAVALTTTAFAGSSYSVQPAPQFTVQTFATGGTIGATDPDSVTFGDGSIWVSFTNGADSTGLSGSSTIARYSPSGTLQNTWTIAGNVDGLRVAPNGLVWALQNNDGNSALTVINPFSNATTPYSYGSSYTNVANRGFDDVEFPSGNIFLSETNPASNSDPIVLRLTSGLHNPLQVAGILNSQFTAVNLATGQTVTDVITDSDSLVQMPNGGLALTGEADKQLVFILNPGTNSQSISFLNLLGTNGQPVSGNPDDSAFVTAPSGYFFMADTGADIVYRIRARGLTPGDVFIDVGNEFGMLDLSTGVVTPIFTGVSPHGLIFVSGTAIPEPGTFASMLGGLAVFGAFAARRLRSYVQ